MLVMTGCLPKEEVVLRGVEHVQLSRGNGTDPLLKADARFYNPNQLRMKLREIQLDVFIDGKQSARIDQKLKSVIKAKSEFTLPLEVQISLKDIGLVDALLGLFGGKQYELHYVGHIKAKVTGFPIRIPVDYTRQVKLSL